MPTAAKSQALAKNRQKARNAAPDEVVADAPASKDLESPEAQEAIMYPKAVPVRIGGVEYIMHELSAKRRRELVGFIQQVMVETFDGKTSARGGTSVLNRAAGIIAERFSTKLALYAAYASGEPGEVSESQASDLSLEFDEAMEYSELVAIYLVLCTQNKVLETIFPGANQAKK